MLSNREIFFRHMGLPAAEPLGIEVDRAKDIYLFDRKGKRYTDLVSGVAVSNIGHLHPAVVKSVTDQLEKYMHLMVYGEMIQTPQTELTALLSKLLPNSLDCVYYVNSGSEAIEGALKLAKRYTGRSEIIAFKKAYHGGTHGALSILGDERLKNAFRPLLPGITMLEFNRFEDLQKITKKTACIVAETIQAEAGIILPEAEFLTALRDRCNQTGTLLIIDDIQMGFGRTGKLFSFEKFGITPDILTLAKAMGGGMPIGAFISSHETMKHLTFNPELGHITTFGGHPVSCAAAIASLNVILENKLTELAMMKGQRFTKALENHPEIKAIRHSGLMIGMDTESPEKTSRLVSCFLQNGLITDRFLFRPQAFRIAPPLTITDDQIDETIELILQSLNQI
ncbi:MAG: aspartate aminotransferase family protein [Bacteroidetes bacterium]|nr:aspartate aminotransferase family protein [Bacteroidota bacterium]